MRIALIGTRGVPARYGGFETAAEEIGRRLVERGHEVIVYCRNPGQTQSEYLGMRLVNLPALRHRVAETMSHTALSVGHTILREHPDVVFVFNAANAPLLPALHAARIPVAVHVDGLEWKRAKWGGSASRYYLWAEALSARLGDAVIADAQGIADYLLAAYGVHAQYIAYGAPIVSPAPDRLAEARLSDRGYHLVVSRFEPENHIHEIVAGYVSSNAQLPLIVVGDAPYAEAYRAKVRDCAGGDPRVRFLGGIWDPEMLDVLYAHALTYLHGHSVGGTNPSLLRALGAGAPVTAFAVNFNRDVAGDAGVYFRNAQDVAALCEAAEAEPEETLARGLAGQADVAVRFRWSDIAEAYEALAVELISKPRARR